MLVKVKPREFIITLDENEVYELVKRLKHREVFYPDLTEPIWKKLEEVLGRTVLPTD